MYVAPELFLLLLILVLLIVDCVFLNPNEMVVALFFWCLSCVHDAQFTLRVPNFPPDIRNNLSTHALFPMPAGIGGHGGSEGMPLEISFLSFLS